MTELELTELDLLIRAYTTFKNEMKEPARLGYNSSIFLTEAGGSTKLIDPVKQLETNILKDILYKISYLIGVSDDYKDPYKEPESNLLIKEDMTTMAGVCSDLRFTNVSWNNKEETIRMISGRFYTEKDEEFNDMDYYVDNIPEWLIV